MRGKEVRALGETLEKGITPAYAGKRQKSSIRISAYRDHPRLCGEKCGQCPKYQIRSGSPPPMRGKAAVLKLSNYPQRITPAYAGKSASESPRKAALQDHPRLCGEK